MCKVKAVARLKIRMYLFHLFKGELAQHPTARIVTATLYIGENGQFKEYPYTFSEKPTPDQLIQAIADYNWLEFNRWLILQLQGKVE